MHRSARDAFGRLLVDPDDLPQRDRVDVLRRLAGGLQASANRESAWLGRKLSEWLHDGIGVDLVDALGLRPPKGSKATAQALVRTAQCDVLLLRLSTSCGGDRAAIRAIRGDGCTPEAAEIVAQLRALKAPKTAAAFSRARARVSRVIG